MSIRVLSDALTFWISENDVLNATELVTRNPQPGRQLKFTWRARKWARPRPLRRYRPGSHVMGIVVGIQSQLIDGVN